MIRVRLCASFFAIIWLINGCAMFDDTGAKKPASNGLISTPPSYYSTPKAKYLGTRYKDNLDRMVERIVRNAKTAPLQFANNISSVGGIGFFTHSAAKSADERYLEVVLGTPETFETKGEYSQKVQRLFTLYGFDLLSILSGDSDIYQDRELSGYGLNLAWRNVVAEPTGSRVTLARAIVYLSKEKVRSFLHSEIKQNDLLADAVIFGEEEDGPLALVSYSPQNLAPDFRPAIREDNLASTTESKPAQTIAPAVPPKEPAAKANQKIEIAKNESPAAQAPAAGSTAKQSASETKTEAKTAMATPDENHANASRLMETARGSAEKSKIVQSDAAVTMTTKVPVEDIPSTAVKAANPERKTSEPNSAQAQAEPTSPTTPRAKSTEASPEEQQAPKWVEPAMPSKAASPAPSKLTPQVPLEIREPMTTTPVIESKKIDAEPKPIAEAQKPIPPAVAPSPKPESQKPAPALDQKPTETATTKLPSKKPIVTSQRPDKENPQPVSRPAKDDTHVPVVEVPAKVAALKSAEKVSEGKSPEPNKSESLAVKSPRPPQIIEGKAPASIVPIKPIETQTPEKKSAVTATKTGVDQNDLSKKSREIATSPSIKTSVETTDSAAKPVEKLPVPPPSTRPPVKIAAAEESRTMPAPLIAKTETARSEVKSLSPAAPLLPSQAVREKPDGEQLALLKKPNAPIVENKPLARPAAKILEGFIIQIAFTDKEKAQRWAETMERRGYSVSLTEAGTEGALRVRLGNFTMRDEAERQLRTFKQDGMNGIIINLPQAFKPEARSSIP
jgi:hypothetical protein